MANTPAQDLQEEFLNAVRKSEETVIEAVKAWAETVQSIMPKVPSVQVPGADKLPKPEEVVASAYDFAEQLLATQRKFAEEVVKATTSLMPGSGDSAADRNEPAPRCMRAGAWSAGRQDHVRGRAGPSALPRTIVCVQ